MKENEMVIDESIKFQMNKLFNKTLRKHGTTGEKYNLKQVNTIIHDENKLIVCTFKESLIWNEPTEILRR